MSDYPTIKAYCVCHFITDEMKWFPWEHSVLRFLEEDDHEHWYRYEEGDLYETHPA